MDKKQYIFILGNNPALSRAEILTVLPEAEVIKESPAFLVLENPALDSQKILNQLGGTIKIGEVIGEGPDKNNIIEVILARRGTSPTSSRLRGASKINFGFSYYQTKADKLGMVIKGELKNQGVSSRLVVSREPILSSVIVKKNHCLDFLVLPGWLGLTTAVQDFEEYGRRDFGRPASDSFSGMLPPKAAKIMINLARPTSDSVILDPFCGSGTILTEAMALGYKKIIGCDISQRAVDDTKKNIDWLIKTSDIKDVQAEVFLGDARSVSQKVKSVDAIVTEPYLGPALKGKETEFEIKKIKGDLEKLYLGAWNEFKKIVKPAGRVVMVIPQWHLSHMVVNLNIFPAIEKLGFKRLDQNNLIYKREGQKVWRVITVWEKI